MVSAIKYERLDRGFAFIVREKVMDEKEQNLIIEQVRSWKGPSIKGADEDWVPIPGEDFRPFSNPFVQPPEGSLVREKSKKQPLTQDCVSEICDIWSGTTDVPQPHWHCYPIPIKNTQDWSAWRNDRNYPGEPVWFCHSLSDAANKYSWRDFKGGSFEQLSWALQSAIGIGHTRLVRTICLKILEWGGVYSGPPKDKEAIDWVLRSPNITKELCCGTQALRAGSIHPLNIFRQYPGATVGLPMTSGTTKLFAALGLNFAAAGGWSKPAQDVLIFDGRVAGALGLLARKLTAGSVPRKFLFPRDRSIQKRNPSCGNVRFPPFVNGRDRAQFTRLGASCIAQVFGAPSYEFFMVERALFMVGYDVKSLCDGGLRPCP